VDTIGDRFELANLGLEGAELHAALVDVLQDCVLGYSRASGGVDLVHDTPEVLVGRGERIAGTLEAGVKLAEHDAGVEAPRLGRLPFERGDELVPTRKLLALRVGTGQLRRMVVDIEVTPPT
jgi:hypothetical protein